MMRKFLFTASFILIMSLAMLGLTRGGLLTKAVAKVATNTSNSESRLGAASATEPALMGEPQNQDTCALSVQIIEVSKAGERPNGGLNILVRWRLGPTATCIRAQEFKVHVSLTFSNNVTREGIAVVAGDKDGAVVQVKNTRADGRILQDTTTVEAIARPVITGSAILPGRLRQP
jgi:hypothetical protein